MFSKLCGVFIILLIAACGDSSKKAAPITPSAPVTEAQNAAFEERTPEGTLVWRVTAESLMRESDVIRCRNIFLKSIASKDIGGMEATASTGMIMPDQGIDSGAAVRLENGFKIVTDAGWSAEGASALWNGRIVTASDSLVISRPGTIIHGQSAMIDPHRKVIRMRKVHGMIEGVEL